MPHCTKLTPNLVVSRVESSLSFYVDVLGFTPGMTVPETPPLVFASVTSGPVEIFFNAVSAASEEYPAVASRSIGLSGTLFIEVEAIEALFERLKPKTTVVKALMTQWYGMKEFAIADPDGYVITFAQRA